MWRPLISTQKITDEKEEFCQISLKLNLIKPINRLVCLIIKTINRYEVSIMSIKYILQFDKLSAFTNVDETLKSLLSFFYLFLKTIEKNRNIDPVA